MKFIWVIAGAVLAGLILGFLVSRRVRFEPPPPPPPMPQSHDYSESPRPASMGAPLLSDNTVPRPNPRWRRLHGNTPAQDNLLTNWEECVQEILDSDDDDDVKAKEMLRLFPRLPQDGQIEVAEQAGSLLPDQDYGALAEYTTNSALAEPVLDALLAVLVTRSDPVRLPLLLSIAEDDQHPKSEEALETLEVLLGETFGTNWDQWSTNLDQRLLGAQSQTQDNEMTSPPPEE